MQNTDITEQLRPVDRDVKFKTWPYMLVINAHAAQCIFEIQQ